jgi:cyclopropane fatty-acyl-phospholipid synthase-like methyltransferase
VGRLIYDRHEYVPWVRVFEIGCGTGSSIMALVEQGTEVAGIDVASESTASANRHFKAG